MKFEIAASQFDRTAAQLRIYLPIMVAAEEEQPEQEIFDYSVATCCREA